VPLPKRPSSVKRETKASAMSKRRSKATSAYQVGYAKPPRASQFKPGESGNPKGRPRGTRPLGALLTEILQQKIPVTEHGKTKRLPALLVMLRRLANDGMRGDKRAIQFLLSLVDRYGEASQALPQFQELLAEDAEILAQYAPQHSRPANAATKEEGDA